MDQQNFVKPYVGMRFRCPDCGKWETCRTSHQEMVAQCEMIYGKEFDLKTAVLVCDECGDRLKKLHEKRLKGG